MARKPVVSRNLRTTLCTCLVVDTVNNTNTTKTFTMPRTWANTPSLLKALQKRYDTESEKIVHVSKVELVKKHYAMPEEKFAELADEVEE